MTKELIITAHSDADLIDQLPDAEDIKEIVEVKKGLYRVKLK